MVSITPATMVPVIESRGFFISHSVSPVLCGGNLCQQAAAFQAKLESDWETKEDIGFFSNWKITW